MSKNGWVDPLTRPIVAATVPASGVDHIVEPTEAERAALAKALNLHKVGPLKATFRLARKSGGAIAVTGELTGTIEPYCIATSEPFPVRIREKVDLRFAEADDARAAADAPDDDPPDEIENGMIDLGRVTTEFLSLAIPPFPRKPGAAFEEPPESGPKSPFEALKALKKD